MNLFDELQWRELVHTASEGLPEAMAAGPMVGYIGFDPTAASLHVGSLLPVMNLARMQRLGHRPIAIAGGGTGLIGDPSGKTVERQLMTRERVAENLLGIRGQLERFLDFEAAANPAKIIDNADWLTTVSLMDFLRDIGKYFTVNYMLAKDSVKSRMGTEEEEKEELSSTESVKPRRGAEEGISFTEFSYMLLQAYDFLVLYDREGCTLQMGGSDQWGNIVAGIDLIRKLRQGRAHGLVSPLVTTSSGVKFGKTEAGAVWLDGSLTSPFQFFQFWYNTDDRDVVRYLRFFTWLGREEIEEFAGSNVERPAEREAQRRLAREVTRAVHGETELARAERAAGVLFGEDVGDLGAAELAEIFHDVPSSAVARDRLAGEGAPLADLLAESGLASSKGDARRSIESGGIYVNNRRVADVYARVVLEDAVEGTVILLRRGRKNYHLLRVEG